MTTATHDRTSNSRTESQATAKTARDLGANDARVSDYVRNVGERVTSAISNKLLHPLVEQYAQLFAHGARTPVLRRPDEYGMDYEDLTFPSADGVPLEAWFIPADSDRLLIVNHPMPCNRYGYPVTCRRGT